MFPNLFSELLKVSLLLVFRTHPVLQPFCPAQPLSQAPASRPFMIQEEEGESEREEIEKSLKKVEKGEDAKK